MGIEDRHSDIVDSLLRKYIPSEFYLGDELPYGFDVSSYLPPEIIDLLQQFSEVYEEEGSLEELDEILVALKKVGNI
jgi:hypothetical protein